MSRSLLPTLLLALPLTLAGCDLLNLGKDVEGDGSEDTNPGGGDQDSGSGDTDDTQDTDDTDPTGDRDGDGYTRDEGDCDDNDADVHPGADDNCGDNIDNDCDGSTDEDGEARWFRDADGDGYGDRDDTQMGCERPNGYVSESGDCDDGDDSIHPDATEQCNETDDDCDGTVDEGATSGTWYQDADGDGYGDDDTARSSCERPGAGWIAVGGDCDDTDADVTEPIDYPADDDGDGFGDPNNSTLSCTPLAGNDLDCDDTNANEPQVVDSAASGVEDGSMTNPWGTIQEGIDNARLCVAVLPGLYEEAIDFGGNDVEVFSTAGPANTTIDSLAAGSTVTFANGETAAAELRGFTIRGGSGTLEETSSTTSCGSGGTCYTTYLRYYGGGVFVDGAAPTLRMLSIASNSLPEYSETEVNEYTTAYVYSYGGGVFVTNSRGTTIEQSNIALNEADQGAGIYIGESATVTMETTSIFMNGAGSGGGLAVAGGTLSLTNAIVANNVATGEGGGMFSEDATVTWWNVTAAGNAATNGGGVAAMGTSTFYLYSSIIYDTNAGQGVFVDSGATVRAEYSDVYGSASDDWSASDPTGTSGNISSNPSFTSYTDNNMFDDDYSLSASSACKNTGNPSASYYDADGTRNDMGAYGGPGGSW